MLHLKAADVVAGLKHGALLGLAACAVLLPSGRSERSSDRGTSKLTQTDGAEPGRRGTADERRARFGGQLHSWQAQAVADWVVDSNDHRDRPFAILDKMGAKLFVFDKAAQFLGSSMVLLGSAIGDETLGSVRDKPLATISPEERTTPAGRFVSEAGHDSSGESVIWVDYDAAVAIHRVQVIDPKERRFERMATSSAEDKRISNGCINVPWGFFETVVRPALADSRGVVYILPDVKELHHVFPGFYDVVGQSQKGR